MTLATRKLATVSREPGPDFGLPILFVHLPKTAGSSFLRMLQNTFGDRHVYRIEARSARSMQLALDQVMSTNGPGVSCVTGHFWSYMLNAHAERVDGFTILREPVARVLSLFRFVKAGSPDEIRKLGLSEHFSLQEFLDCEAHEIITQTNNGMTRSLCGDPSLRDRDSHNYWHLEDRRDFVDAAIATLQPMEVGLAEQMSTTLELMRNRWGIPFPLTEYEENASQAVDEIQPEAALDQLQNMNRLDIELYEKASALFSARALEMYRANLKPRERPLRINALALFKPCLSQIYRIDEISGREGFEAFEASGIAWLGSSGSAKLHFSLTPQWINLTATIFSCKADYPVQALQLSVDRRRINFRVEPLGEQWHQIVSEPFRVGREITALSVTAPLLVSAQLLAPGSQDHRRLSVAFATLCLSPAIENSAKHGGHTAWSTL